ncbi:MAG: pyridoxamine 5'-phosphate oxidase family protein [Bacteroidota bacterium]
MNNTFEKTARNTVKRAPKRGHYDEETLYNILDAGFMAHVGFVTNGQPFVIPMAYGREENKIYIHGAATSRLINNLEAGVPVCLTVTHLDGLVLARSAYHHSMNYRSAVVFGTGRVVEEEKKEHVLYVISEQILKGRWDESRAPNQKELKGTTIIEVEIDEASSKIRTGAPVDEKADYDLDFWAGVVPINQVYGEPEADPLLKENIPLAESVKGLK